MAPSPSKSFQNKNPRADRRPPQPATPKDGRGETMISTCLCGVRIMFHLTLSTAEGATPLLTGGGFLEPLPVFACYHQHPLLRWGLMEIRGSHSVSPPRPVRSGSSQRANYFRSHRRQGHAFSAPPIGHGILDLLPHLVPFWTHRPSAVGCRV